MDDILASTKHDELINDFETARKIEFVIKNLGEVQTYLGIHIERKLDGIFERSQPVYIGKVIKEFGLAAAKISEVPITAGYGK